jgi:hypothetical protein
MNTVQSQVRGWLMWIVPFAVLALLILWQVDWGRAVHRVPPPETGATPQPITLSMLPEYRPAAPGNELRDAVERTLFNPTRRPAPTALAEAAKPRMQRGQFTLAGTLVVDGKATAYLKETAGGKSRRVAEGETINGMVVAEVKPDRVRFTLGDESEELGLKVASGPKTTIQPVVAAAGAISATAAGVPAANQAVPGAQNVSEILAERRRAARAAEAAAQGLPPGAPIANGTPAPVAGNSVPPPPVAGPSNDPAWQGVYQRYQQQRR